METKKVLGIVLIIIGAGLLLFAGWAALGGAAAVAGLGVSKLGSIVPFIIGLIFFASGIKLIKQTE